MLKFLKSTSATYISEVFGSSRCMSNIQTIPSTEESSVEKSTNCVGSVEFKNALFESTRKRQLTKLVPRLEKIEVHYQGRGISDNAVMFMNKHLSTPHQCAMHLSKNVADSSVLAIMTPFENDETAKVTALKGNELITHPESEAEEPEPRLWDMHRPLPCDCKLEILKFNMENSTEWHHQQVNRAYWSSCSLVLGAVMQEAFKRNYELGFYHQPYISETRGAFCYDVALDDKLKDWSPSEKDLIYFTKVARSIISKNLKFERLEVTPHCALEMFDNDRFRSEKIQEITELNGPDWPIVIYRLGQFIDLSLGPHISSTSLMYHFVVSAFHRLNCSDADDVRRVQGLSLPQNLRVHHAVWSMLESRSRKLVKQNLKLASSPDASLEKRDKGIYKSIENKTKQYMISTGQWQEGNWKDTEEPFEVKSSK